MSEVYLGQPPIDWEDVPSEGTVPADATLNDAGLTIDMFRSKMGKLCKITGFGQAWDSTMETFMCYSLLLDGIPHPKYHRKTVQITAPEQVGFSPIPTPIVIGQGVQVSVLVHSTVSGNFAARVRAEYFDPS